MSQVAMPNLRLDRAVSVYLGHPLARGRNGRGRTRLPILMYHSISEGFSHRNAYYETNTSPRAFERQVRFLSENGYTGLTLAQAAEQLAAGCIAPRTVAMTFDDGFSDFSREALPVLQHYRFPATLFVVAALAGGQFMGRACLGWEEVRALASLGIEIGSHSLTHPELASLPAVAVQKELAESKRLIEDRLGAPVRSFAYPYAFPQANRTFVSLLERTLAESGYTAGVTTVLGRASARSPRLFLPRLPVNTWDDPRLFRAKLEGGYDWLRLPQAAYKRIRG